MDQTEFDKEVQIDNEFDYSDAVAQVEPISYLVKYCEALYNQLIKLSDIEEEKNAKLKYEYKNYEYKKTYNTSFLVIIKEKGNLINCKNYQTFMDYVNNGYLRNVDSLTITLDLTYKRGMQESLKEYENNFKIIYLL